MGKGFRHALTAMVVVAMAAPVAAQSYSDSFTFLKAVKERDGSKVTSLLAQPGTVVVNAIFRIRPARNGYPALPPGPLPGSVCPRG